MSGERRSGAFLTISPRRAEIVSLLRKAAGRDDVLSDLSDAVTGLGEEISEVGETSAAQVYRRYRALLHCFLDLLRWGHAVRSAEVDADRFLKAAKTNAKDVARDGDDEARGVQFKPHIEQILSIEEVEDVAALAGSLSLLSLPLPITSRVTPQVPRRKTEEHESVESTTVVFTEFRLDDAAVQEPHTVTVDLVQDLSVDVSVSRWNPSNGKLVLEPITVEPPEVCQLPVFEIDRPSTGAAPYRLTATGRLLLKVGQSLPSRPLQFSYRARFEQAPDRLEVVGQRQLYLQSHDPATNPISGYAGVDNALLDLRNNARSFAGVSDRELGDFLVLMTGVCRLAQQALQDDLFDEQILEREFQERLRDILRLDPRIGGELEEHPAAGGGETDLSFRKIRLELKVENNDSAFSLDSCTKYFGQTAQYVVASDRRFGALCVLDGSQKTAAPGLVVNDIGLRAVAPPVGEGLSVLLGVVVVRGCLPKPSDLSKG
ncbi:MAG: hypothetical protein RMA76_19100 [Deltaproteobacteria bacterium]|jgi:hypothetical protein